MECSGWRPPEKGKGKTVCLDKPRDWVFKTESTEGHGVGTDGCAAEWTSGVVCREWLCRRSPTKVWVWRPEALANGEPYLYLRVSIANVRACRERFRRIRDRNARADTPLPREPEWSGAPIGYRMNYRSDGLPSLTGTGEGRTFAY